MSLNGQASTAKACLAGAQTEFLSVAATRSLSPADPHPTPADEADKQPRPAILAGSRHARSLDLIHTQTPRHHALQHGVVRRERLAGSRFEAFTRDARV